MKIALCTTQKFVPPLVGGVDVYTARLGEALKRLGHELIIIALDANGNPESEAITVSRDEYDGTKIWRLEFSFARRPQEAFHLAYDPEMGRAVREILADQQPALFIIINFYMLTLASVEAANELGIPVAHVVTDFIPICRRGTFIRWDGRSCQVGESVKSCSACFVSHRPLGRFGAALLNKMPEQALIEWADKRESFKTPHPLAVVRPYLNQVAIMKKRLGRIGPLREKIEAIFVPTRYTREMYLANGFRPDQVHFLPFGVDPDHRLARVKPTSAAHTRFLFIGRLQPYKGAHLLIKAFNDLPSPEGATLTIYGTPDGHDAYFEQVKGMMAANDRIRFAGKIDPSDLGTAFAAADFFVLPSTWHENSPLILLDALQSKTPVIASDVGGVNDVVKDGVNGLLFPMGDAAALQRVMQRAIDQPALVGQLRSGVKLPQIDDYARAVLERCQRQTALRPAKEGQEQLQALALE